MQQPTHEVLKSIRPAVQVVRMGSKMYLQFLQVPIEMKCCEGVVAAGDSFLMIRIVAIILVVEIFIVVLVESELQAVFEQLFE